MVITAPALNFQPQQATLPVQSFLQRLMLVTDSSVVDIIEAYFGEPVTAVKLQQRLVISGSELSPLRLNRDHRLLNSSILLQGSQTKTNYLYAEAQIVLDRFATEIRDELISSRQSIDKLLRQHQTATYRKTLYCGLEPAGSLGKYFALEPAAELIYRTYLIFVGDLPAIQVSEKFPTTQFLD